MEGERRQRLGRAWRRILPVAAVAAALALFVSAAPSSAEDQPASANIVEEVRVTQANGYILERHILVDRSIEPDTAAAADAIAGTTADSGGTVTAQYVLNRWKWPSTAIPVAVSYNPANENGRPSLQPMIIDALQQWSSVSGSAFRFAFVGTTSAHSGACESSGPDGNPDGINTIEWVPSISRPGVLGQTCTVQTPDGRTLVEFDMQLNASFNWGTGLSIAADQYDLASTILHEVGHAAGIGHSKDGNAVMFSRLALKTLRRTLTPDDMDALREAYPDANLSPQPTPKLAFPRTFSVVALSVARD